MAQTVFTCLYIHNPDFIEDPAMKAFALGILKICDIAREKVNKAAVFEEVCVSISPMVKYVTLCIGSITQKTQYIREIYYCLVGGYCGSVSSSP